ncbi:hypothetical protein T484DRAFT_1744335 [Baffinella frigidus]|nr:hypothetical protein T484DRAFT_1744335 [Cryptophyta sp. CCMP2293]
MGSGASQNRPASKLPLSQEGGIGCVLEKVNGNVCIASVLKSGAAACSGTELCKGDVIMQVDNKEFTSSSSCDQVASALRGKVHTVVRVWIRRKASGKIVSARIVRQPVPGKPIKDAVLEFGHIIPVLTPQNDPPRRSLHTLPGFLQSMRRTSSEWIGQEQREKRHGAEKQLGEPRARLAPCLAHGCSAPAAKGSYFA